MFKLLTNINKKFPELESLDYWFLALRVFVFSGGLVWIVFTPLAKNQSEILIKLFLFFLIYSIFFYFFFLKFIIAKDKFYKIAGFLDLFFLFLLTKNTGGINSAFSLAFLLLVAIHSYYFGVLFGLFLSLLANIFIFLSDIHTFANIYWTESLLRFMFVFLIAFCIGFLSEVDKKMRHKIENLCSEVEEKSRELETAYKNLQTLQKNLIQTEKLTSLGTLVAGISHEINNPVSIILSRVELIEWDIKDKKYEGIISDLHLLKEQAQRISNISKALLSFSRKGEISFEKLNLNEVIKESISLVEKQYLKEKIIIRCSFFEKPAYVKCSKIHLQQVFLALFTNAKDAMAETGGVIKVSISQDIKNRKYIIMISDTGPGIPEELQQKIFDPFFTTKPPGQGTGLGLAIAFGIIEAHNGKIELISKEGAGTKFKIILPGYEI